MKDRNGKKRRKWVWVVAVLILAVVGVFLYTSANKLQTSYKEVKATVRDVSTYYSFSGSLTPVSDKRQTAKEQGKVKELYVAEGDTVAQGDALLRLTDGTRIFAAASGVIEELDVEKDDAVAPGTPLARIVDYETLEVSISVDEYDVDALTLGKTASVLVNALDKAVTGTVSSIANSATTAGGVSYYEVKLTVPAQGGVKSGMSVEATVLKEQALSAVCVPIAAIQYDESNAPFALVKRGGELTSSPLTLGVSDGQYAQVLSGVTEGESLYYAENDMMRFFMMRNAVTK